MAANPKDKAIEQSDINTFLDGCSDFSFEMEALNRLSSFPGKTQRNGTYTDPITKKIREFDIRLSIDSVALGSPPYPDQLHYHFAIECKNFRPDSPLLVHCVKRAVDEAYFNILVNQERLPGYAPQEFGVGSCPVYPRYCPLYPCGEFVGTKSDKVQKHSSGKLLGGDSDAFDKINQAVCSADALIAEITQKGALGRYHVALVVPILVIPDERLWSVSYDDDGSKIKPPMQITDVTYYIARKCSCDYVRGEHLLSHLHITTISHLPEVVKKYLQFGKNGLEGIQFKNFW